MSNGDLKFRGTADKKTRRGSLVDIILNDCLITPVISVVKKSQQNKIQSVSNLLVEEATGTMRG